MNHKYIILNLCFLYQIIPVLSKNKVLCARELIDSDGVVINETTYCKVKPCLISVCSQNEVWVKKNKRCQHINTINNLNMDMFKVYKYEKVNSLQKTNKTIWDAFNMVRYKDTAILKNDSCVGPLLNLDGIKNIPHLLENGSLLFETPNEVNRFSTPIKDYSLRIPLPEEDGSKYTVFIVFYREILTNGTTDENVPDPWNEFFAIGMLISGLFMILVLVVYANTEKLRDGLVGWISMAYIGTLALGFFFKASQTLSLYYQTITSVQCAIISPITNFAQISSFAWMSVLSFNIWWTFRSTFYRRNMNRRGVMNKFMWYAMYGWIGPLALTIAEVIIDNVDLTNYPNFVKPDFRDCAAGSKWYLLIPITVVLATNCVLFFLTSFNIWRVGKGLSRFNSAETQTNKENKNFYSLLPADDHPLLSKSIKSDPGMITANTDEIDEDEEATNGLPHDTSYLLPQDTSLRALLIEEQYGLCPEHTTFVLYVKLSVLMGINWIFDMLFAYNAIPDWLGNAAGIYSAFIGIIIFIVLVFKKSHLSKKFWTEKGKSLRRQATGTATFNSSSKKSFSSLQDVNLEPSGDIKIKSPDGISRNVEWTC